MKKLRAGFLVFLYVSLVLVLLSSVASAQLSQSIVNVVSTILCEIYKAFRTIVTGVALMVFVLAGVKWTASENDPGARKAAKDAMIHAIVGIIIVIIAYYVVDQAWTGNILCSNT